MAYLHISSTRDVARSVNYAFDDKEENNEKNPRVLMSAGINIGDEKGIADMKAVLSKYGKDRGDYVQGQHIIQSFGKDELSKDNEDDVLKANKIGYEFANDQFGDERQVVVVTQADGEGGMLHNHIVVNNVSFIDGRSLRGKEKEWSYLTQESDKVLKNNDLEPLQPVENKVGWDKVSKTEVDRRKNGLYVWKDDLKQRIDNAMNSDDVKSESDFKDYMRDNESVDVEFHDFVDEKGRNVSGISYKFEAENEQTKTVKAKSLGAKFMRDNVNKELEMNNVKSRHVSIDNFAESLDIDAQIRRIRPSKPKKKRENVDTNLDFDEKIRQESADMKREQEAKRQADALAEQKRQERIAEQKAIEEEEREKQRLEEIEKENERKREIERQRQIEIKRLVDKESYIKNNPILVDPDADLEKNHVEEPEPEPEEELEDDGPDL